MAQAQRILRHRVIELGARGAAIVEHHRFVASECAHPVARRRLARGEPEISQQIGDGTASLNGDSGGSGSGLAKMYVRIDEAGGDGAARELDQMSSRADQRFQFRERTVRDDHTAGDRNRVAAGMAEDETLVQNQIGFAGRSYHQVFAFVASI
jgi:hypothetical protein